MPLGTCVQAYKAETWNYLSSFSVSKSYTIVDLRLGILEKLLFVLVCAYVGVKIPFEQSYLDTTTSFGDIVFY